MQHYELMMIVKNDIADADVDGIAGRTHELITKAAGTVGKTQNLGRRKLAYPIKRETQGSYVTVAFDAEQKQIAELERQFRLMPELVRHHILQIHVKSEAKLAAETALREKIFARRHAKQAEAAKQVADAVEAAKPAPKPVSKEELEKKLDTLLGGDDMDILKES